MALKYSTQSFTNASDRLDAACAWLKSIGINYSPTRVGKYRKIFADVAARQQTQSFEAYSSPGNDSKFKEWINATHEVAEIIGICEALSSEQNEQFVITLKKALRGHESQILDNDDRSGRDFSFELSIASKFIKAGYTLDFGHDADIATNIENHEFFAECKRPRSHKKAAERISEGLKQLEARYESSKDPKNARGILVIAIGKVVNAELGLLISPSAEHLSDSAFAHTQSFVARYRGLWQGTTDPRTLATVVILDTPAIIESTKKTLVTCREVAISNCIHPSHADHEFMRRATASIFNPN